ncbi:UNVERIFIED_CONTAM: hypothetical protein NCL1_34008 [Trichonephila clavipes]
MFRCTQAPIARKENPPSRRPIIFPCSNSVLMGTIHINGGNPPPTRHMKNNPLGLECPCH